MEKISKEEHDKKVLVKNTFLQGAFISTLGIVISKILGIIYVIPFHAVVKEQGGALYGYAYTIYSLFLGISSAGIPLAISKIISEYQTLGYYDAKERAFKLGKNISILLGLIAFVVLFIFAPTIAHAVLGELTGGNTIEQVTFVIRVISTAIIVVPLLSIYRGYLEGHKYLTPSSVSNVIEQVVRVFLIIFGSYLSLKVFHQSLENAVGIAVFGATLGALVSYFYLLDIVRRNRKLITKKELDVEEPKITNKEIIIKILWYSFPFIMIDFAKSMYDFIDMTTIVKTLGETLNYTTHDAESIMSIISTWGNKFNMIIASVSTGVIVSLIPNLTASFVKKDKSEVNHTVNQTFQVLLLLTLPMTIGLSLLAEPVWMVFYGPSKYGALVFSYFVFIALFMSMYTTAVTITQVLKDYKTVFISLFCGVILKILLNVRLMILFNNIGIPAYYGSITATILGYLVSLIICMYMLKRNFKVNYKETFKEFIYIIISAILMTICLLILKIFIPISVENRLMNIFIIGIYSIIGAIIYFICTNKFGSLKRVFGEKFINNITSKVKKILKLKK